MRIVISFLWAFVNVELWTKIHAQELRQGCLEDVKFSFFTKPTPVDLSFCFSLPNGNEASIRNINEYNFVKQLAEGNPSNLFLGMNKNYFG